MSEDSQTRADDWISRRQDKVFSTSLVASPVDAPEPDVDTTTIFDHVGASTTASGISQSHSHGSPTNKSVTTQHLHTCNGASSVSKQPVGMAKSLSNAAAATADSKRETAQPLSNVSTVFTSNHRRSLQVSLSNYEHNHRSKSVCDDCKETHELQTRSSSYLSHLQAEEETGQQQTCLLGNDKLKLPGSAYGVAYADRDLKPASQQSAIEKADRKDPIQSKDTFLRHESFPRFSTSNSGDKHRPVCCASLQNCQSQKHYSSSLDSPLCMRRDKENLCSLCTSAGLVSKQEANSISKNSHPHLRRDLEAASSFPLENVSSSSSFGNPRIDLPPAGNVHRSRKLGHVRREETPVYPAMVDVSPTGYSSSDCPSSDTQPLLTRAQVYLQDVLGSPEHDLCLDNSLIRFHATGSSDQSELNVDQSYCGRPKDSASALLASTIPAETISLDASRKTSTGSDTVGAPPLSDLYRYHVFLSHCAEDVAWVQDLVERLEKSPYTYKCVFSPCTDKDQASLEQSWLCAAMLSERVVLVLSQRYVQETWYTFERVLRQLTQMSLHNQRIMGVLLEDCDIPETLGELYFLDTSDPDFFEVFAKRLKSGRIPRSSESVSSDLASRIAAVPASVVNGQTLAQCTLTVKVGWDSYLQVLDTDEELPPSLKAHGINLEKPEYSAILHNVSTVSDGTNKLPWVLCVKPLLALILAGALWLPAFIAVLAVQVDDNSGMALPVRLVVFLCPLGIVSCGYLLKWRRRYWLSKIVRILVQNCVKANQLLYCEGRPILTTAGHVRANNFAVHFVYFDLTDCVRSVDLLLFTCLEDDWDKLMRLVEFYARDKAYLSQVSMSERLTVMMAAAYLLKLVRGALPHPPQQRHINGQLCLCQFTEECVTRFVHSLDRDDVPALSELFARHLFGYVSGSTTHRINTELYHRLQ